MPAEPSAKTVTVIVTQRERFGMTAESLDSLYAHVGPDVRVVVVDGCSPPATADWLRQESRRRGFRLIRRERHLTPNRARNLGVAASDTDYVAFVDNDVLYTDGWLNALIACAEETGAAVVAPLTCQGLPAHREIHHAGGDYAEGGDMERFIASAGPVGRAFNEVMHLHGAKVGDHDGALKRQVTGMCEFHCVLVRRDVFTKTGPLDEAMLSTKEHIDFSMAVRVAGEEVWFEPASVVTYVFPCRARPLTREDWPFFLLRWSDTYGRRSLERFISKWRLRVRGDYVAQKRSIYATRRMQGVLIPMLRRLPLLGRSRRITQGAARAMRPVETAANDLFVRWYDRRRAGPAR